jgi:hypothetical protein
MKTQEETSETARSRAFAFAEDIPAESKGSFLGILAEPVDYDHSAITISALATSQDLFTMLKALAGECAKISPEQTLGLFASVGIKLLAEQRAQSETSASLH